LFASATATNAAQGGTESSLASELEIAFPLQIAASDKTEMIRIKGQRLRTFGHSKKSRLRSTSFENSL